MCSAGAGDVILLMRRFERMRIMKNTKTRMLIATINGSWIVLS
jgi:hypothetical protein